MKLFSAKFEFSQEGNSIDHLEYEHLEVRAESSEMIDDSNNCFLVLKTDQWSINSKDELSRLLTKVNEAIDVVSKLDDIENKPKNG